VTGVRAVFWGYVVVLLVGIGYSFWLGLAQR
jgi:hypothetical protein